MLYAFGRFICMIILSMRRIRVHGNRALPPGGVIIAANHISNWDPMVVGCVFRREISFMAKAVLFKIPLLGFILRHISTFPVKRNQADRRAVKHAVSLLREGKILGIFPEGTRSHTNKLLKPHAGAFFLASMTQVPVLPVAVSGSRGLWGRIDVYIGEFMPPPEAGSSRPQLESYAAMWAENISRLLGSGNERR